MPTNRIKAKIVLCGSYNVGKTSLRRKYMGETFIQDHLDTLGADFSVTKVDMGEDTIIELEIWDLASQPGFEILRQRFFKGTSAAIMVFDLSRPDTFLDLDSWFEQLYRSVENGLLKESMPIAIMGNRTDQDNVRVTEEEVQNYIATLRNEHNIQDTNITYYTTSEKTGENINSCLFSLANSLFDILEE